MSGDLERKIHSAYSRAVEASVKEERCLGSRGAQSQASCTSLPGLVSWTPSPIAFLTHSLVGPGTSKVLIAMPVILLGDKEICNLIKMTCYCLF